MQNETFEKQEESNTQQNSTEEDLIHHCHTAHDMKDKDFSNILWAYFTQHSNQRMQMMNFYIILETFLFTGMLTLYNSSAGDEYSFVCIGIGIAAIFFSFIFWNLDRRTRELIHICENSIKALEDEYEEFDKRIRIISYEEQITAMREKSEKKRFPLLYSNSFLLIYLFFSIAAVVIIVYFLIVIGRNSTPGFCEYEYAAKRYFIYSHR